MALELFAVRDAPAVEKGFAHNIKSAKRTSSASARGLGRPRRGHRTTGPAEPPTLHRLGIQAFMPVLVEGSAIQIHLLLHGVQRGLRRRPDGRPRPAVHAAQEEARAMMLSTANLLSPADGSPVVAPTQDMVLGCFYLTMDGPTVKNRPIRSFTSEDDAVIAYELGARGIDSASRISSEREEGDVSAVKHASAKILLHEPVDVVVSTWDTVTETRWTSRSDDRRPIRFNRVLPDQMRFANEAMRRVRPQAPRRHLLSPARARRDGPPGRRHQGRRLQVRHPRRPHDRPVGHRRPQVEARASWAPTRPSPRSTSSSSAAFTDDERYEQVVELWQRVTKNVPTDDGLARRGEPGPDDDRLRCPREQGQHRPAGRRARPDGRPVRPDHRRPRAERTRGMTVLEYFISTHGARAMADTALAPRTPGTSPGASWTSRRT
jgi:hypothetical protein